MADTFTKASTKVLDWLGSPAALIASVVLIIGWLLTGPMLHFTDTWQLIINTTTTIITFLMVFVIQNSQNRDMRAIETKLDAILTELCHDHDLAGLEEQPDKEIKRKQKEVRNQ